MRQSLNEYRANITLAKQLAEAETSYFGELNADEQKVLSDYYFARQPRIAEDDLDGYRQRLAMAQPDIENRAIAALGRLKQTAHYPGEGL